MVLAEKNSNSLRNGQRSRGPSPNSNGGGSPSSPMDEEGEKIRVGRDYQAVCPELIPPVARIDKELGDRALLVWSPSKDISDQQLDEYIQIAKEKYGYNGEQALGMLFWHKHNLEKAVVDLANFTPFPDEWTAEDKVLFEQAFTFHGKTFHRIRQMLPDKTMGSLVKYYYSWKKTRTRTSLMDRQARKGNVKEEASEQGSEQGSNSDSETEESKAKENGEGKGVVETKEGRSHCHNCGIACTLTKSTPRGVLCNTCFLHWRTEGHMRPTIGPMRGRDRHSYNWLKKKWRPPRGMHINHEDLVSLSSEAASSLFVSLDREIASLKRQVQNNKQSVSSLKKKSAESIEEIRPSDAVGKTNARWTSEEVSLAVQGIRKYGKNCKAIADTIGSKTEAHVRSFFATHRKRCGLDLVLKQYNADNGLDDSNKDSKIMKMDVENEVTSEQPTAAAVVSNPPAK